MPQVTSSNIDDVLIHFGSKARIKKTKMKLSSLKPSQKEINDNKVIKKMGKNNWKTRKYLVSKDKYLADGHHDWASGLEFDPDYEVDAYQFNIPIKAFLKRLNQLKFTFKKDDNDIAVKKGKDLENISVLLMPEAYTNVREPISALAMMYLNVEAAPDISFLDWMLLKDHAFFKMTKEAALYVDKSETSDKCINCRAICAHHEGFECDKVGFDQEMDKMINPEGWCRLYTVRDTDSSILTKLL